MKKASAVKWVGNLFLVLPFGFFFLLASTRAFSVPLGVKGEFITVQYSGSRYLGWDHQVVELHGPSRDPELQLLREFRSPYELCEPTFFPENAAPGSDVPLMVHSCGNRKEYEDPPEEDGVVVISRRMMDEKIPFCRFGPTYDSKKLQVSRIVFFQYSPDEVLVQRILRPRYVSFKPPEVQLYLWNVHSDKFRSSPELSFLQKEGFGWIEWFQRTSPSQFAALNFKTRLAVVDTSSGQPQFFRSWNLGSDAAARVTSDVTGYSMYHFNSALASGRGVWVHGWFYLPGGGGGSSLVYLDFSQTGPAAASVQNTFDFGDSSTSTRMLALDPKTESLLLYQIQGLGGEDQIFRAEVGKKALILVEKIARGTTFWKNLAMKSGIVIGPSALFSVWGYGLTSP